ncbi:hypothetical protein AUP68_08149 [Ilyonectria robusta]
MSINWDTYKPDITRLYINGNKTAEETIEYLNEKHGAGITIRKFKSEFGSLKKLQAKEWRAIFQEIRKRKAGGKDSEVYLCGRRLNQSRVDRAKRRYDKGTDAGRSASTSNGWEQLTTVASKSEARQHKIRKQSSRQVLTPYAPPQTMETRKGFVKGFDQHRPTMRNWLLYAYLGTQLQPRKPTKKGCRRYLRMAEHNSDARYDLFNFQPQSSSPASSPTVYLTTGGHLR